MYLCYIYYPYDTFTDAKNRLRYQIKVFATARNLGMVPEHQSDMQPYAELNSQHLKLTKDLLCYIVNNVDVSI